MATEERVAIVDLAAAVKAHQAFLLGPTETSDELTPTEQEAVVAQQRKLRRLQERFFREKNRLSEAERTAMQEQVRQEIVALQELYSRHTRALFERQKWSATDNVVQHLRERVREFGQERKLSLLLDRSDRQILYRDPALTPETPTAAVDPAQTVDLTQALIDWLREKDRSLAPTGSAVSGS